MISTRSISPRPFQRISFLVLAAILAGAGVFLHAVPATAQLGPYPVVTPKAQFDASIVKLDKDILWVRRVSSDGASMPQIGIATNDVLEIKVPPPAFFAIAEKALTAPAIPDELSNRLHSALDKFILQFRQLRRIPGIPCHDAMLLKGKLYAKKGMWKESLRPFEDVRINANDPEMVRTAQIWAGVAYEACGEHNTAIEYLGGLELPEEEEALMSQMLFALGDAFYALENYDNALLSYLPLVVFYPYVGDNEARGMAKTLGCYAALKEWEPLYRTLRDIKATYPDSIAAKTADEYIEKYGDDLAKAGMFIDGEKIVEDAATASVTGTTVDYSKPEDIPEAP